MLFFRICTLVLICALIDSHKRLQIEYNNRPIRDASSKNIMFGRIVSSGLSIFAVQDLT
jgi:hypothetical protein